MDQSALRRCNLTAHKVYQDDWRHALRRNLLKQRFA
ncbi:hypothetical protein PhaeoP18_02824 [Phaeobacter piscinae]|uniref:Uncharacterized protein n=1 Tax=Phaeobacter piscinae TaxID=1580596 RepID=A0AAN1LBK8_9RHOB|nr:hypothetical protein PhaeoP13_02845 [Phaeobacter piscinae]AUQ73110.1 hypothetical protein PhaeoP71_00207 [Phaeobacter piscinae]AUR37061.1 hypothetical protein PhaeoP18_02824 [Phaeobacter piscinae]